MTPSSNSIFLNDDIGAVLTALFLGFFGVVEPLTGLPRELLFSLAAVASGFAVYSFSCHAVRPRRWRPFLVAIGVANLGYGLATMALVLSFQGSLSLFAWFYFTAEFLVLIALALFEFRLTMKRPSDALDFSP